MNYLLTFDNEVYELMGCINESIFEFEKKKVSPTTANSTESTLNQNTLQVMLSTHDDPKNAGSRQSQKSNDTSTICAEMNNVDLKKISPTMIKHFRINYGLNLTEIKNNFRFLLRLATELSQCTELMC